MLKQIRSCCRSASYCLTLAFALGASGVLAAGPEGLNGEIGLGAAWHQAAIRGQSNQTDAFPYLNLDSKTLFARVDVFGVKTLEMGKGYLELAGQWRFDGYTASGLARRQDSVPLGVGTLQTTDFGAFWFNAFHDFGSSRGNLLQARYLAEFELGKTTINPELGFEYQSLAYAQYYYAPRLGEAPSYTGGAALNPFIGVFVETHLSDKWYLSSYLRRTTFDQKIADSPIVSRRDTYLGFVALSYHFR